MAGGTQVPLAAQLDLFVQTFWFGAGKLTCDAFLNAVESSQFMFSTLAAPMWTGAQPKMSELRTRKLRTLLTKVWMQQQRELNTRMGALAGRNVLHFLTAREMRERIADCVRRRGDPRSALFLLRRLLALLCGHEALVHELRGFVSVPAMEAELSSMLSLLLLPRSSPDDDDDEEEEAGADETAD